MESLPQQEFIYTLFLAHVQHDVIHLSIHASQSAFVSEEHYTVESLLYLKNWLPIIYPNQLQYKSFMRAIFS